MHKFLDRLDAGEQLAAKLAWYLGAMATPSHLNKFVIVGLPSGGVPVDQWWRKPSSVRSMS
jgi:predicted phosphoribosyltransferase